VPGPPIWNRCPHFTFGLPVDAYIQYCIFKMWPPLLLNSGDGPGTMATTVPSCEQMYITLHYFRILNYVPNFLNYVQHNFPGQAKPPLVTGLPPPKRHSMLMSAGTTSTGISQTENSLRNYISFVTLLAPA